jgi:hypothetical protein
MRTPSSQTARGLHAGAFPSRQRIGSALILVLIMTLSLAGLAISAIYLSSSAGLLTRFYDRERDYRYAAEAALALGKSRITNDTLLVIPSDTPVALLSNASLTDASGNTIPRIKVNLYAAFTGDTTGKYGQFVTLIAQAYDSGGTRYVRRLDMVAQSFARYAMFTNISPSNYQYGPGEFLKGVGHSNGDWKSVGSGPGPHYYDTITAVGTITGAAGNAIYDHGKLEGVKVIPYPTVPKLATLITYATAANLNIVPVSGTTSGTTRGTRLEFLPIDMDGNGQYDATEGFFRLYDLATGKDTTRLRADLPWSTSTASVSTSDTVYNNQCGASYTISGIKQFFPYSAFVVAWVDSLIRQHSTSPVVTAAQLGTMANHSTANKKQAAFDMMMAQPSARCYPAGDPHLMLTERFTNSAGTWADVAASSADTVPWVMSATSVVAHQYGGEDTTFSPVTRDCALNTTTGQCVAGTRADLGTWRAWPGTAMSTWPATNSAGLTPRQALEKGYTWPFSSTYNTNSKSVVHIQGGKIYMNGVFRGNITVYADSDLTWVDDLVYDQDPTAPSALCRNMLGIIVGDTAALADNAINRPRVIDWGGTKISKFLGPNEDFYLDAIMLSIRGTVMTENPGGNITLYPSPVGCPTGDSTGAAGTSGGCWFQTGGTIQVQMSQNYGASSGSGLRMGRTLDPCQLTNQRPAFFPSSMQYVSNKYYEIDPVNVNTFSQVYSYYQYLRGRAAP